MESRKTYTNGLNYDLIKEAVKGDTKAIEKILHIYEPFINSLVTYDVIGADGKMNSVINDDWKSIIQIKLIDSIKKWREMI